MIVYEVTLWQPMLRVFALVLELFLVIDDYIDQNSQAVDVEEIIKVYLNSAFVF